MNVLYKGKYKKRSYDIINRIDDKNKKVLDLCFGDVIIAEECKKRNIEWIGFDINPYFAKYAQKKGFNASTQDIEKLSVFPKADICILSGSLYHFYPEIKLILAKMLDSSAKIIISEPIINLTSQKGIIGKIAGVLSNAGKGEESFRFTSESIKLTLSNLKEELNYDFKIIDEKRDILIEITHAKN